MNTNLKTRIIAFAIDYCIAIILIVVPLIGLLGERTSFYLLYVYNFIGIFIYCCIKDIVMGRSIGKRIMKIGIKTIDSMAIPPVSKLILRNLLTCAWPVELIYLMNSKSGRKIGDVLAGTDVYCISKPRDTDIS